MIILDLFLYNIYQNVKPLLKKMFNSDAIHIHHVFIRIICMN